MQHNARDPYRDHSHGRIYRITSAVRPLLNPPSLADAEISELLDLLKSPEDRMRYRVRRALRGHSPDAVVEELDQWVHNLDPAAVGYKQHLLEGLWVSWGMNRLDNSLLLQLFGSGDYRLRAAAVRALRYNWDAVPEAAKLLKEAASDTHSRVRLEALVAASWMDQPLTADVLERVASRGLDTWTQAPYQAIYGRISGELQLDTEPPIVVPDWLGSKDSTRFLAGREIYLREGYCATCHQEDGHGLPAGGFPPLAASDWVNGSEERLIKVTLKGLQGPMMVNAQAYDGSVPMTGFEGLLTDEEIAEVLTYVRNAFGNRGGPVATETVARIREEVKGKKGFYQTSELK
jgi:mono/diheme cytochrome c family protein